MRASGPVLLFSSGGNGHARGAAGISRWHRIARIAAGAQLAGLPSAPPSPAQAPARLVKDLGPALTPKAGRLGRYGDWIAFGSEILFSESPEPNSPSRPDEGELWKTDGT